MYSLIARIKNSMAARAAMVGGFVVLCFLSAGIPAEAVTDLAQSQFGLGYAADAGLPTGDLRVIAANIIRIALGLIGVVLVAIIIYAGYSWMTAAGDAERVAKAKKTLLNAIIGFVVVVTSYAITSFIISSLTRATIAPGQGGGGTTPIGSIPGGWPWGCPDPKPAQTDPYICGISKTSGPVGDFVTIRGGRFGTYDAAASKVYFRKGTVRVEAAVAACGDRPAWFADRDPNKITVEVPAEIAYDPSSVNTYVIVVETAAGNSDNKQISAGPSRLTSTFELTAGTPGPGIACILPEEGSELTAVTMYGKRFGAAAAAGSSVSFQPGIPAPFTPPTTSWTGELSWSDTMIQTAVPAGAISGDVVVTVGGAQSNGYHFGVTCSANSQCSLSGCCAAASYCTAATYCAPGIGQSCNATPQAQTCSPGACQTGLFCDAASDCTCQLRPEPSFPSISAVTPIDGAPGNLITIFGSGFGSARGTVLFMGSAAGNGLRDAAEPYNDSDQNGSYDIGEQYLDRGAAAVEGVLPQACDPASAWRDTQIIIAVPAGAENGPIAVITAANTLDTTDADGNGSFVRDFTVTAVQRPGICALQPDRGPLGTAATVTGVQLGTPSLASFGAVPAAQEPTGVFLGGAAFGDASGWEWTDGSIGGLSVPNLKPGKLTAQVRLDGESSNPVEFTVVAPADAPVISYVNPVTGPTNQYVTIFGSGFGTRSGFVYFYNGEADVTNWTKGSFSFPEQCGADYWKSSTIVVKVPAGVTGPTRIAVERPIAGEAHGLFSNEVPFTVCSGAACPLRPGVCAIVPDQAPALTTDITMYGEGFGAYGAQSTVRFWDGQSAALTASDWTSGRVGTGKKANTTPAGALTVPQAAVTGPVTITDASGTVSNQVRFTVADCRTDDSICSPDQICCPTDGRCQTESSCGAPPVNQCRLTWNFFTAAPSALRVPRVIEDKLCTSSTQSPTPWKNSTDVCVNAQISARFDLPMLASSLTDVVSGAPRPKNIVVRPCGTGAAFDAAACAAGMDGVVTVFSTPAGDDSGFIFQPAAPLTPNTWYHVRLIGGAGGIRSRSSVALDGDRNGTPGGDYSWVFRARDNDRACDIDRVIVQPQEARLETLTQTQGYSALPVASNCNILNPDAYDWAWTAAFSNGTPDGPVTPRVVRLSADDRLPEGGNGLIDWKQTATPLSQGLVYVGAQPRMKQGSVVTPLPVSDTDNRLEIDLGIPEITSFTPTDGAVRDEVGTFVTIYGRNFGDNPALGKVYFGDTPAQLVQCGTPWTDTQIQVQVPVPKDAVSLASAPYTLTSPRPLGAETVGSYGFDDASGVIADDASALANDGELAGVAKVPGQFGTAASFTGAAGVHVRIPGVAGIDTGTQATVEAWVRIDGYTSGQSQVIASRGAFTETPFLLRVQPSADPAVPQYEFMIRRSGTDATTLAAAAVRVGQWQQVVGTYGDGYARLYVDGVLRDEEAASGTLIAGVKPIYLGELQTGGGELRGAIDYFGLHRRALTGQEVRQRFGMPDAPGQLALYRFEDTGAAIADASVHNHPGAGVGNPQHVAGRFGQALTFNGTSQAVRVEAAPVFNHVGATSLSFWFKPQSLAGAQELVSRGAGEIGAGIRCGGGIVCFSVPLRSAGTGITMHTAAITDPGVVKLNEWNSFVGIYDGTGKITLTVNGTTAAITGVSGQVAHGSPYAPLCLGAQSAGGTCAGSWYAGALDSVALYGAALDPQSAAGLRGVTDNEFIRVEGVGGFDTTDFNDNGAKDAGETFRISNKITPFLCELSPAFGGKGTPFTAAGENFGDGTAVTYRGAQYHVGSFAWIGDSTVRAFDMLDRALSGTEALVTGWSSTRTNLINDKRASIIPVQLSIDPDSEPYQDKNFNGAFDHSFSYTEPFANRNENTSGGNPVYDLGERATSNALNFRLAPVIVSISPNRGPVGQWVTLSGTNFGDTPGTVTFADDVPGILPPQCASSWSDTQIIVEVPAGAVSGPVQVTTHENLQSNQVQFTVTTDPVGPGICALMPARGTYGEAVAVTGIHFYDQSGSRGEGIVRFAGSGAVQGAVADGDWTDTQILTAVPTAAVTGPVAVVKREVSGRSCAGFSIGGWCPGGQYDAVYRELPSNAVAFTISDLCTSQYFGTITSREASFPVTALGAETGTIATDGTYLYTKAYLGFTESGQVSYGSAAADRVYRIGTGMGGTVLGRVYGTQDLSSGDGYTPSFVYGGDGYLYTGRVIDNSDDTASLVRYQISSGALTRSTKVIPDTATPRGLIAAADDSNVLLTATKENFFNVSAARPDGRPGFAVRVYGADWSLQREFLLAKDDAHDPLAMKGIMADGRYIYIFNWYTGNTMTTIDWRSEAFGPSWKTQQLVYNSDSDIDDRSTLEISGQYDWVNRRYWTGQINPVEPNLAGKVGHARIYRYKACSTGTPCTTDAQCVTDVCALGASRCVNGQCTPVITAVNELTGNGAGSWVTVQGCHFGCGRGDIFFTGDTEAGGKDYIRRGLSPDPLICGETWRCAAEREDANGDGRPDGPDEVIIEVPNEATPDTGDDAVTGPIRLVTLDGYSDTTADATPGHLQANIEISGVAADGPQLCRLMPSAGARGSLSVLRGKNFATRSSGDYVQFDPVSEEPYADTGTDGLFDRQEVGPAGERYNAATNKDPAKDNYHSIDNPSGTEGNYRYDGPQEPFIDLDTGSGFNQVRDTNLSYPAQQVTVYPSQPAAICPASGWSETAICMQVPAGAVTGNVRVVKADTGDSNALRYTVAVGPNVGTAPTVEAVVPADESVNACRNGMPLVIFDQAMDLRSIMAVPGENGHAPRVRLELCGETVTAAEPVGLVARLRDLLARAFGRSASAAQTCTPVASPAADAAQISAFTFSGKTYVQIRPSALLESDRRYRVIVIGGVDGVRSARGAELNPASAAGDTAGDDFVMTFTTSNVICALDYANVQVYTGSYSGGNPFDGLSQQSTSDLFICTQDAGCAQQSGNVSDHDQDTTVSGNQHIYVATGYTGGGYRCVDGDGKEDNRYTTETDCTSAAGRSWVSVPTMAIRASFLWYRSQQTDAQGVVAKLYAKRCVAAGGVTMPGYYSAASCATAGGSWVDDDTNCNIITATDQAACTGQTGGVWNADPFQVRNESGLVFISPRAVEQGFGRIALLAQAYGTDQTPVQTDMSIAVTQCANPWPSFDEQFPVAAIVNAFNFQTYYCRDAGDPNTTADDLPATDYIVGRGERLSALPNMDFESGSLAGWTQLEGGLWRYQPTTGGACYRGQWRDNTACRTNPAVPIGINGAWYIGTADLYQGKAGQVLGKSIGDAEVGALSSGEFLIEGTAITIRIGGSNLPWAGAAGSTVPSQGNFPTGIAVVALEYDSNNDKIIDAIKFTETGAGSDMMRTATWDVSDLKGGDFTDTNGNGQWDTGEYCADTRGTDTCKQPTRARIRVYDYASSGHIQFDSPKQFNASGAEIPFRFY